MHYLVVSVMLREPLNLLSFSDNIHLQLAFVAKCSYLMPAIAGWL